MAVPFFRKLFSRRSTLLIIVSVLCILTLTAVGLTKNFGVALVLLTLWALLGSVSDPVRRAYLNQLIDSRERATVLSFDGMVSSLGGAILQSGLGRSADLWGYSVSFVIAGLIQILGLPFLWLMKKENSSADHASSSSGSRNVTG